MTFMGGVEMYRFGVDAPDVSDGTPYDLMPADRRPCSARLVGEAGLPLAPLPLELAKETSLRLASPKLRLPRNTCLTPFSLSSSVSPASVRASFAPRSKGLVWLRAKLARVGVVTVCIELELDGLVDGCGNSGSGERILTPFAVEIEGAKPGAIRWAVLSDGVADRERRWVRTVSTNETPLAEGVEIDFRRARPRRVSVSASLSDEGVYRDIDDPNPTRATMPPTEDEVDAVEEALDRVLVKFVAGRSPVLVRAHSSVA